MNDAPSTAAAPTPAPGARLLGPARAALLALAAGGALALGELAQLRGTDATAGTAFVACGLALAWAWPALILTPLVLGLRRLAPLARAQGPLLLGATLGTLLGLTVAERLAARLFALLHRPDLAGLLLALAVAGPLLAGLLGGGWLARRLAPRLPHGLTRFAAPLAPLAVLGWGAWRATALELWPHLPTWSLPACGVGLAGLLAAAATWPRCRPGRGLAAAALAACTLLPPLGLLGAHRAFPTERTQRLLLEQHTPLARTTVSWLRRAWDGDGDGFSPGWGGGDCADHDRATHPGAPDAPGDGRDQDCLAGDLPAELAGDPLGLAQLPRRAPLPDGVGPYRTIILIIVDALRFDATAGGGARPSATPQLDRLAARAAWFDGARSPAPGTWPAVPSLLTGRYPHRLAWGKGGSPPALAETNRTLPELLGEHGWRSAALVAGYMRWRLPGLGQGFASFESAVPKDPPPALRDDTSPQFLAAARAELARGELDRFFYYIHFIDPHHPYSERPGFTHGRTPRARYLGELAYTDDHLGQLVQTIEALPGADETLIVVTGDHGEEFGEHGGSFHAGQLYEESLHVPLLFLGRGIRPGRRSVPVSLVDLLPTLLDLVGLPAPPAAELDGRTLVPDLFDPAPPAGAPGRPLFAELGPWEKKRQAWLLEAGRLTLIERTTAGLFELYDLARDPRQRHNLIDDRPADAARGMARLQAWARRR